MRKLAMALAGGAYFFAYLGFLIMVVAGWLFLPRASFVITMAVLVHNAGLIDFSNGIGGAISIPIIIFMVLIGIIMDNKFIRNLLYL